jgi:hypothetical protein
LDFPVAHVAVGHVELGANFVNSSSTRARGEGLDGFYGYGVYVCLPKSVIRHVIRHVYAP